MIVYQNVLGKLKDAGYTTYTIKESGVIGEGTLQRIRLGKAVNLTTIDRICQLLHCPIEEVVRIEQDEDILPFTEDPESSESDK